MYLLVYLCLLIYLDICCEAETRIEVSAPVNPIDEGAILSVHCQIWNVKKGQEVTIFRNRTKLGDIERLSLDNKVHIEDNNVFLAERQMLDGSVVFFLSIIAVTRNDEGEYYCKISSVTGSILGSRDPIDSVKVHFTYFPSEPDPTCSPSGPLTVNEGSDVSVDCSSLIGNPTVTLQWKRAGSSYVFKSNVIRRVVNGRVHAGLTFTPSKTSSGAVYICTIKSPAFSNIERTCHVGPVTVLRRDGLPYPLSVDSEHIREPFTVKPVTFPVNTNTEKPMELSCNDQCHSLIAGSPVQLWIIATITASILTLIFIILGVLIMIKYYRLTNAPQVEYTTSPYQYSEDIYVEVDGKRRENYVEVDGKQRESCMYMSLENSKKHVLQPVNFVR